MITALISGLCVVPTIILSTIVVNNKNSANEVGLFTKITFSEEGWQH